jgi:hypothetical protein
MNKNTEAFEAYITVKVTGTVTYVEVDDEVVPSHAISYEDINVVGGNVHGNTDGSLEFAQDAVDSLLSRGKGS